MCHWIFTIPYNWLFFGCLKQWATFHPIIEICLYIYYNDIKAQIKTTILISKLSTIKLLIGVLAIMIMNW